MVRIGTAAVVLALMATPLFAQESTEQLKKELEQLRAEVDGLKAANLTREIPATGGSDVNAMAADDNPVMTLFKQTKLSGFVDTSFNYSLRMGPVGTVAGPIYGNRAYDTQANTFVLQAVQLNLERLATKDMIVGYHFEIALGRDPFVYGGLANLGTTAAIGLQEAWVEILAPIGNGLNFKMGKLTMLCGYEVPESKDDMNFSRGLLYTWAMPTTTTGLRINYEFAAQANATLGLNNGWGSNIDLDKGKNLEFQLELKPVKDLKLDLNVLWGPEAQSTNGPGTNRFLLDLVLEYKMDKLTAALEFDWGFAATPGATALFPNPAWGGAAVYLKYQMMDIFAPSARVEYYSEGFGRGPNGFEGTNPGGVSSSIANANERTIEFTLTAEFKVGNALILRLEYRHDDSILPNGAAGGGVTGPGRGSDSIALEAIMPF